MVTEHDSGGFATERGMNDVRDGSRAVVVRVLLIALTGQGLFVGLPALLVPRWFYDSFPFGTGWLQLMGPYAEHFVVDTGSLYLGVAATTIFALIRPSAGSVRAAALANLVGSAPHAVYHTVHGRMVGALPTIVVAGAIWLTAAGSIVVLMLGEGRRVAPTP